MDRPSFALLIAASIAGPTCTSKSSKQAEQGSASEHQPAAAGQHAADPGITLECIYDHLQNPPESFHYVYKKDATDHVDQEADITPQTIEGFRRQFDGSIQPLHAVRSDRQSWQNALAGLTAVSGMSSAIALVHNGSALKRESDGGLVNGYETIHYSIDTARWDDTERKMLGSTIGSGGFEKGEAWVTAQGCPVKLSLDAELHQRDGSLLERIHYEVSMIKK